MVQKPPEGPYVAHGNKHRASSLALQAGTDMGCHDFGYLNVTDVSAQELDQATRRVLTARVRCALRMGGGWWVAGWRRVVLGCWLSCKVMQQGL